MFDMIVSGTFGFMAVIVCFLSFIQFEVASFPFFTWGSGLYC